MLKNVALLTKTNLLLTLGLNEAKLSRDPKVKKKGRRKKASFIFLCLLLIIYSLMLSFSMVALKATEVIPTYAIIALSSITFILGFTTASNDLFNMKSYEQFIVLPFTPNEVIASRLLTTYLINEAYCACGFLPSLIIYGVFSLTTPLTILAFIPSVLVVMLLFPIFPLIIASIFSTLFLALTSKLRYKTYITNAISLIFIIAIILVPVLLGNHHESDEQFLQSVLQYRDLINVYYFNSRWVDAFIRNEDGLSFLYFFLVTFGSAALFVYGVQKEFVPISNRLDSTYSQKNYSYAKEYKSSSCLGALLKKDFKQYLGSTSYFLNTLVGYVVWLVFTFILIFTYKNYLAMENGETILSLILLVWPFGCSFFTGVASTTFVALSLEGSHWWISLTLPLKAKDVYNSKILLSLLIALPFYLLVTILSLCLLPLSIEECCYMAIYPVISIVFSSLFGLHVNIKHAEFNWVNESKVVKSSGNTLYAMLLGLLLSVIPALLASLIPSWYNSLALGIFSLILIFFSLYLYHKNNLVPLKDIPTK